MEAPAQRLDLMVPVTTGHHGIVTQLGSLGGHLRHILLGWVPLGARLGSRSGVGFSN